MTASQSLSTFSAAFVAPLLNPFRFYSSIIDVKVGDKLTLLIPVERKLIDITFPAEAGKVPTMRLPEPKFKCSAYEVFDETVGQLKRGGSGRSASR
ncbi:MAG: hypothetical protein QXW41_08595 [Fervidicoccaceae archaeon]